MWSRRLARDYFASDLSGTDNWLILSSSFVHKIVSNPFPIPQIKIHPSSKFFINKTSIRQKNMHCCVTSIHDSAVFDDFLPDYQS